MSVVLTSDGEECKFQICTPSSFFLLMAVVLWEAVDPERYSRYVHASAKHAAASGKGFRRHHGDVDLYLVLACRGHCAGRPGLVGLLRWWRRGEGDRQERALVCAGGDDLQLRRARAVYRVECDVRPWRRVPRGQTGTGWNAGKALGFGAAVRLRTDRPDQFSCRRTICRRLSYRHA